MEWHKTKEETPNEDMMCLVVENNSKRVTVLNWNEYHKCWDDFDADDYCCNKEDVDFWIPFSEIPKIPNRD